ncbi:inactive serine/threonine-protein kinase VRK3 isoform X2 [Phyllopteryx taeniolatus]|uniref:inactive serine/threonine-protein kinase VRK3 isoform X2 n=1 Tax=Phyllopteryx taeniolatus TaxID=161469 RepID=UPI002AD4C73D|nr:inactive serine/threonine-protein kinase VRK3 isoform X2 [Phyllopteryx taeniolatus]
MTFRFCPQCGTKLQSGFKFCPSCGEKIPCATDASALEVIAPSPNFSPPKGDEAIKASQASSMCHEATDLHGSLVSPRPALRKTRNSLRVEREVKLNIKEDPPPVTQGNNVSSSPKQTPVKRIKKAATDEASRPPLLKSPRSGRGKGTLLQPVDEGEKMTDETMRSAEESTVDSSPRTVFSSLSSPASKSPFKARGQSKAKKVPAVERLEDGKELTDTTGRKWTLVKLLSQSLTELVYEVVHKGSWSSSKESAYILKMGAERGRIYKEQNFLQRAAKPLSVAKWIKQHDLDFLGIPSCVGFGHTDSYRFLVFPAMGQSLQSVMDNNLLPEKTVLHLACRILDVLHYIHSNEYVHADINGENISIQAGRPTQVGRAHADTWGLRGFDVDSHCVSVCVEVYLVGYYHASRYCPSGRHVGYRQGIQEPHEGSLEFISVDSHKGAAPSRRSDLQSLGYCMLQWHTGALPWSGLTDPDQVADLKQRYMDDIPALLSHCFGRNKVSSAIQSYVTTVADLQYTEQPDYPELKARLAIALSHLGGSVEKTLSF